MSRLGKWRRIAARVEISPGSTVMISTFTSWSRLGKGMRYRTLRQKDNNNNNSERYFSSTPRKLRLDAKVDVDEHSSYAPKAFSPSLFTFASLSLTRGAIGYISPQGRPPLLLRVVCTT